MTPPDLVGRWTSRTPGTWATLTVAPTGRVAAVDAQDGHTVVWGATADWCRWLRAAIAAGTVTRP